MVSPQVPQEEYPLTDEARVPIRRATFRLAPAVPRSPRDRPGQRKTFQANYEIWSGQLLLDRFKFLS